MLPGKLSTSLEQGLGWDDELCEGAVGSRIGLDEGGEDLSMFREIPEKGIAAPPPHYLHCFYWEAQQQVEEGGSYPNPMALQQVQASQPSGDGQPFDESCFGEG
jgi:hypothetical protein